MIRLYGILCVFLLTAQLRSQNLAPWIVNEHPRFSIAYRVQQEMMIPEYTLLLTEGIQQVQLFFKQDFYKSFQCVVHPNRHSLDSTWQADWKLPGFKSECWMVASGVSHRLDILSPAGWDTASCEHSYKDRLRTLQLITHELVHVFHGQCNKSPDFSAVEGIDWFVEGLAVYASGQLDTARMNRVRDAVRGNKIPLKLDYFWTGKLKYGLSGSLVQFLWEQYGMQSVIKLMQFTTRAEILNELNTTESVLMEAWKEWVLR